MQRQLAISWMVSTFRIATSLVCCPHLSPGLCYVVASLLLAVLIKMELYSVISPTGKNGAFRKRPREAPGEFRKAQETARYRLTIRGPPKTEGKEEPVCQVRRIFPEFFCLVFAGGSGLGVVVIWYRKWLIRAWLSRGVGGVLSYCLTWFLFCATILILCFSFFLILWFSLHFSLSLHYVCCIPLLLRDDCLSLLNACDSSRQMVWQDTCMLPDLSGLCTRADWRSSATASILLATLFSFHSSFLAHRIFIHLIPPQSEQKIPGPSNLASLYSGKENIIYYYEFLQQMKKQNKKKTRRVDKVLHHMHSP